MSDAPDPILRAIARLEDAGAGGYDAPTLRLMRALVDRAERYPGGAADRLRARARQHLDDLERRFGAEREAATRTVEDLVDRGYEREAADDAIARGDLVAIRRAARRAHAAVPIGQSRRRGVTPTARPERGGRGRRRRARRAEDHAPPETGRYRESLAELVTDLSLDRSRRTLPAEPGPYNGRAVAARLLEAVASVSPVYAHTQIERMRELAALARLPDPSAPKKGRRRRR